MHLINFTDSLYFIGIFFYVLIFYRFQQHLVDWSKAMLPQIKNLGPQYDEWVHKPVDRSLRLFEQDYLEMLTKTPWWLVPAYWIPIIIVLIYLGASEAYGRDYNNVRRYTYKISTRMFRVSGESLCFQHIFNQNYLVASASFLQYNFIILDKCDTKHTYRHISLDRY